MALGLTERAAHKVPIAIAAHKALIVTRDSTERTQKEIDLERTQRGIDL